MPQFNSVCVQLGVILSHQEVNKLVNTKQGKINFKELSKGIMATEVTERIGKQKIDRRELERILKTGMSRF